MEKKTKFIRTAITVPATLKTRMAAIKGSVNWSNVACIAFERKLDEIAARKDDAEMSQLVRRLRESKREVEGEAASQGFTVGKEWATKKAEYKHLANLAKFNEKYESDSGNNSFESWAVSIGDKRAFGPGEILAEAIEGEKLGRNGIRGFWEEALGHELAKLINDITFIIGFNKGALEIWEQVKDQL